MWGGEEKERREVREEVEVGERWRGEGGGYGRASKRMVPSSSNSRHAEIGGTMSKI